jgi:hypothetical protein
MLLRRLTVLSKFYRKILYVIFTAVLVLAGIAIYSLPNSIAGISAAGLWQPNASAPIHWQWQIGTPFNTSTDLIPNVTVYDIDAFDTSASVVAALHAKGFIVVAYANFGTYENWRPDAASFPASVKGSSNGWPGENWLDIRSDAVKTIMAARLDLIKSKGFDAVEPDNVDGYSNSTGFPLSAQDQLNYNEWIAAQCHQRGLSVGLKNDVDQVSALQPYFDWTLNEESYKYSEYSGLSAFTSNNKAVFEVEYGKSTAQAGALNALHFNSMTRDLDLVSPASSGYVRLPCIPDTQNSWTAVPQTTTTTPSTTTTTKTTTSTSTTTTTATMAPVVTTGTVKVSTTPAGASLIVDGTKSGLSPLTLTLSKGSHIIQASLSGFQDTTSTVNIAAGDNITVTLILNQIIVTTVPTTTTTVTTIPPITTTTVPTTTATTIPSIPPVVTTTTPLVTIIPPIPPAVTTTTPPVTTTTTPPDPTNHDSKSGSRHDHESQPTPPPVSPTPTRPDPTADQNQHRNDDTNHSTSDSSRDGNRKGSR